MHTFVSKWSREGSGEKEADLSNYGNEWKL
jgi:hypothetical protein